MTLTSISLVLSLLLSTATAANAQAPASTTSLAEKAARRFPQPVRVSDLIGRQVLEPVPAQHVLGRVMDIRRNDGGGVDVVIRTRGLFGFGTRLVDVPVEAIALLGEHVALMEVTPEQLRELPNADGRVGKAIAPDDRISVGLTKPFH